jgi:rubrerythrin
VNDQIAEIMETAMMKEVASAALYHRAAGLTSDPAAAALLRELAAAEENHLAALKKLPEGEMPIQPVPHPDISRITLSEYLIAPDELPGADLPGTLLFAIRQEASAAAFYQDLADVFSDSLARELAVALSEQEREHQAALERLYETVVYVED